MKYGFIGLGNMTTAIIKGMCNSGDFDSSYIYGYNTYKIKNNKTRNLLWYTSNNFHRGTHGKM
ncbi:hypothetical protein LSPH26S_00915 [Lysinibacillus sphaericus]